MAKGTSIHAALEHYLQTGEVLVEHENADAPGVKWPVMEFVQCAIAYQRDGQTLVPPPICDPCWKQFPEGQAGLMIEQWGEIGTWPDPGDGSGGGPQWRQKIDLIEAYPDRAIIQDWKTTSNLLYAKTPDELAHNGQLIGNAKWLLSVSDYKEITLRHFYLSTKNKRPKAMAVDVVVTREHVEAEWQKILGTVREMVAYYQLNPEDPNTLPPNTDHCSAYGGCSHRQACGLMASENVLISVHRMKGKGEATMGILQSMLAKAGAAAGVTGNEPKAEAAAQPEPAPVPAQPTPEPAAVVAPQPEAVPAPPTPVAAPQTAGELHGYDPNGIVPPDAPLPTSTPEEVALVAGSSASGEAKTEPADTSAEPGKRKRRTKAEMEAARAAEATPSNALTETGTGAPVAPPQGTIATDSTGPAVAVTNEMRPEYLDQVKAPAPETEAQKVAKMLLTPDPAFACPVQALFIDCLPSKGWPGEKPVNLDDLMHSFNGLAASSAETTDYRLIPYGAGKGYLANAIRATMKGLPASLCVDTRTPGADVFLETVIPYARLVVRGVR
jgi:hypothetical protein